MAHIVVTEFMDEAGLALLRARFEVLYDPTLVDHHAVLLAALPDTRALIVRNRTKVGAALLAAAPRLEVIGRLGVGLDNLDLKACAARRVPVLPAAGANEIAVAEFVIGAAIVLLRAGAFHVTPAVLAGKWPREQVIGREAFGLRMGLLGFGAIARQVARRACAFGMQLAAHDPFVPADHPSWREYGVEPQTLDALLASSDVLSIHTPLTPDTRHLLGAEALARLPKGAVLINTARGGIVDERALAAALQRGHLGGAVLDVVEEEPLKDARHLSGVPNLILVPHVAGVTAQSNLRISTLTADNVLCVLAGRTPSVADAAAAWR